MTFKEILVNILIKTRESLGMPFIVMLGLAFLIVSIIGFQKYCDSYEEYKRVEKIKEYNQDIEQSQSKTSEHLEKADSKNKETSAILETLAVIKESLVILNKKDRETDKKIKGLEAEYFDARNQKREKINENSKNNPVNNVPLNKRVDGVLARDGQLYDDSN